MLEELSRSVAEIISALERSFRLQENVVFERFKLNSSFQSPNENVDSYISSLRHLAFTCEFSALTDELVRDRLVIGVIIQVLKKG